MTGHDHRLMIKKPPDTPSTLGPPHAKWARTSIQLPTTSPYRIALTAEEWSVLVARARSVRGPYRDRLRAQIVLAAGSAVFWLAMQSWLVLEALEEPPSVKTRMCAVVGELNSACSLASRSSSYPTSSRANVAFDRA
jgi:hypothetical protein